MLEWQVLHWLSHLVSSSVKYSPAVWWDYSTPRYLHINTWTHNNYWEIWFILRVYSLHGLGSSFKSSKHTADHSGQASTWTGVFSISRFSFRLSSVTPVEITFTVFGEMWMWHALFSVFYENSKKIKQKFRKHNIRLQNKWNCLISEQVTVVCSATMRNVLFIYAAI